MVGFVYVLTNEWMPGLVKIGGTAHLDRRLKFWQTALPGKSNLRYSQRTAGYFSIEERAHGMLRVFRVRESNDWFSCSINQACQAVDDALEDNKAEIADRILGRQGRRPIANAGELGSMIRDERERLGITQIRAADLCNVDIRFLSELERGKATCELGKALYVASCLGVDVAAARRVHG